MKYALLFTLMISPLFAMQPQNCPDAYEKFVSRVSKYFEKCRKDSIGYSNTGRGTHSPFGEPKPYTDHQKKQRCERKHIEIALNKYIKECGEKK